MMYRGRTVLVFVLIAVAASVIMTTALVGPSGLLSDRWSETAGGLQQGGQDRVNSGSKAGFSKEEIHKLDTTYRIIDERYMQEVDRKKLIDGAIQGMLSALEDPYTVYMDPEQTGEFEQEVDSFFTGIGAEVSLDSGNVVVVAPIKGSPAERAGIRPRDLILTVNGESLAGLSLAEAVEKIRGPKGTQAKLQIKRDGQEKPIDLIVVRDEIDLETVYSEMLEGGIGKIEIRQFSVHTVNSFRDQLAELEKQNLKGLILDVRSNPGGYLDGVVQIMHTLVPKGKLLLQMEDRDGNREELVSEGPGRDYPMTVLMNGGSASASEILAAAVQQSGGGKLVGENSFGKGTVQSQFSEPYGDGSMLKMSIAKWLTPDGTWIHEKGVAPDVAVKQPDYFYVAPINRDKTLRLSDMGEDVRNMQIMLDGLGYSTGRKDGYFSAESVEALKLFQQKVNLKATGELNAETIERLENSVIELLVKPENDRQLQEAIRQIKSEISSR